MLLLNSPKNKTLTFGDENMAVMSIIKLSELEGNKRIDADYYQPEYLNLLERLKKVGCVPVKYIADPVRKKFKPKEGEYFNYIEISEVDLSTAEFNTSKIEGKEAPDRAQWIVSKDDVLVSTVRPIRNAIALVKEDKGNLVCSSGFSVLHPKTIQANYLFIYFKLPFIAKLLDRYTTATEYPAINLNNVLNVPIYLGTEELRNEISLIVDKSFDLLNQSHSLYSQAEYLLLEELGLNNFEPRYEKTYVAKLSDSFNSRRIDAEYFQPAYQKVVEKLKEKNIKMDTLEQFILGINKGIEPGSGNYQEEGKLFIRVSNLSIKGFTNKDQKYLSEELYQQLRKSYECKRGDFLLTKDATPGIAYVVKEQIAGIISSGILRLNIDENRINKEYLALCVNSLFGKIQIERDSGGSVILHWKTEQVKRLKIPFLPCETQQKIASLVQQSHETRKKAKELLETAKKSIEVAIIKDEEETMS